jgi:hypothetical protein
MEKPNLSQRATAPSISTILKKISDDKALILFNSIAVSPSNSDRCFPLKEMNLSTKQFYSRISSLLKANLIKRHKGKYFVTSLGKVVYESQMIMGKALSYYWKLKAIESIEMSGSGLPNEEKTQLINALIDNHQIKDILIKSISNPSIKSNSKIQSQQL